MTIPLFPLEDREHSLYMASKAIASAAKPMMSPFEAAVLYELGKRALVPAGTRLSALEIGTNQAGSTACIAMGLRDGGGGFVLSVDCYTPYCEPTLIPGMRGLQQLGVDTYVLRMLSRSFGALQRPIGYVPLLHIDGCHDYDAAFSDMREGYKHVIHGLEVIAMHDFFNGRTPGVQKAWGEFSRGKTFRYLQGDDCSLYAIHPEAHWHPAFDKASEDIDAL
jgi:hypothetical protein